MNTLAWKVFCVALSLGILSASAPTAWASPDHERARQALQAGEIMPLDKILSAVARVQPGQILEIELEQERFQQENIWMYEVKGIASDGRLFKLKVDARTGRILQSRTKGYHQ